MVNRGKASIYRAYTVSGPGHHVATRHSPGHMATQGQPTVQMKINKNLNFFTIFGNLIRSYSGSGLFFEVFTVDIQDLTLWPRAGAT